MDYGYTAVLLLHLDRAVQANCGDRGDDQRPRGGNSAENRADNADRHGQVKDDCVILADADMSHIPVLDKRLELLNDLICSGLCLFFVFAVYCIIFIFFHNHVLPSCVHHIFSNETEFIICSILYRLTYNCIL